MRYRRPLLALPIVLLCAALGGCAHRFSYRQPAPGQDEYFLLVLRPDSTDPCKGWLYGADTDAGDAGDAPQNGYLTRARAEAAGREYYGQPLDSSVRYLVVPGLDAKEAGARLCHRPWSMPTEGAILQVTVQAVVPDGRAFVISHPQTFMDDFTSYPMKFAISRVVLTDQTAWCGVQASDIHPDSRVTVLAAFETRYGNLLSTTEAVAKVVAGSEACRLALIHGDPLPE